MTQQPQQHKIPEFKIVVLGGGGVGKSALTIRLVSDDFLEEYDPTIEDSYRKQCDLDGKSVMLDVLDTAGQDDFAALRDAWMREAEGFLLVYSITKRATFDEVMALYARIMRVKEDEESNVHIILVGNKCDLMNQREVMHKEGKELADDWGCGFFETSAKTKINNEEPFFECARLIRDGDQQSVTPVPRKKDGGCNCSCLIL